MNPDHAHFAEWDAAFVMGALSWADRAAYEEHVSDCADCRRAVAELAPTAALLSRASRDRAVQIPDASDVGFGPAPSVRARLLASVAMARGPRMPRTGTPEGSPSRRRRAGWWLVAAVAVLVASVSVGVPLAMSTAPATHALRAVEDVPLEATVQLDAVAWGTRIHLDCSYVPDGDADVPEGGWPYVLTIIGADGASTDVSTWRALPGTTARVSAGVALDASEIRAVEIRSMTTDRVLMRYVVPD